LNVKATDKGTGKSQHIEITGSSGLSEEEIEKMRQDAEANAEADRQQRELVDARNQADSAVYQTRQQLEEHGDKIDAELRGKIESAVSSVEEKAKGEDAEAIQRALTELQTITMELGKAIYESAGAAAGAPGAEAAGGADASAGSPGSADDDVIDAEYEVKDDSK
ncbi:MAG: Hsp70 family protein, partial [Planctomycetota bacterium]